MLCFRSQTGEICLDVLKTDWSPAWTLASALLAVQSLLASPEPSSPLNVDAGALVALLLLFIGHGRVKGLMSRLR